MKPQMGSKVVQDATMSIILPTVLSVKYWPSGRGELLVPGHFVTGRPWANMFSVAPINVFHLHLGIIYLSSGRSPACKAFE